MTKRRSWYCLVAAAFVAASGCGGSKSQPPDAGDDLGDGGTVLAPDFFPPRAPAYSSTDNAPGTVQVSASGEAFAQEGFPYSSTPTLDEPVLVDGWSISFEKVLVVIRSVRLDRVAPDPSQRTVLGAFVARASGPWLVDLARVGPVVGAGGTPETAWPLAVIPATGLSTSTRYAASWESQGATGAMKNVNVPESDRALVEEMLAHGWSKYFIGTATYAGRSSTPSVDAWAQSYPTTVRFRFGFFDAARYVNCANPDLGADAEDPANWGIQPSASGASRFQVTVHLDHLFWDQVDVEGTPLHFDPVAARASASSGSFAVALPDLAGSATSALTDLLGNPVLDRGTQTAGYSPLLAAPPAYIANSSTPNLESFLMYQARGQGHLNSDGECPVIPTAAFHD